MLSDVRKKGILLLASLLLLLSAGIYMAFAWYTKMTSVSDMRFQAATWDFNANYQVSDFTLNVYEIPRTDDDGNMIADGVAAPGTSGYFPVRLSAEQSDVDVTYILRVDKSKMSPEFQERIYFFSDSDMRYTVGNTDATSMTGTIKHGEYTTFNIYWRWAYDYAEATDLKGSALTTADDSYDFDLFDTGVGRNPEAYIPDMIAEVLISGTQVKPAN